MAHSIIDWLCVDIPATVSVSANIIYQHEHSKVWNSALKTAMTWRLLLFSFDAVHRRARHFPSFMSNLTVGLGAGLDVAPGLVTGEVTANKSSSSSSKSDNVVFRGVTGDFL